MFLATARPSRSSRPTRVPALLWTCADHNFLKTHSGRARSQRANKSSSGRKDSGVIVDQHVSEVKSQAWLLRDAGRDNQKEPTTKWHQMWFLVSALQSVQCLVAAPLIGSLWERTAEAALNEQQRSNGSAKTEWNEYESLVWVSSDWGWVELVCTHRLPHTSGWLTRWLRRLKRLKKLKHPFGMDVSLGQWKRFYFLIAGPLQWIHCCIGFDQEATLNNFWFASLANRWKVRNLRWNKRCFEKKEEGKKTAK